MKTFTKTFIALALIVVYCSGYGASLKFHVNNGGTYIPETPVVKTSVAGKSSYELAGSYKNNLNWSGLSKSISKTLNKPQRFRYNFTASTSPASMLGVNLMSAVGTKWDQGNLRPTLTARPNPATNMVTISLEQASDAKYRISLQNTIGKEVLTIKVPESAHNKDYKIDLSTFAPGIYFYSLFSDGQLVMTKRLVKQQ